MVQLPTLSLEQCVTLACLWEVCVPKLGNVHRGADFVDTTLYDFVTSVPLIAAGVSQAADIGVGASILRAVSDSRPATHGNTHLGTILLLAPMCAVPRGVSLSAGIGAVLSGLTPTDSSHVYQAIQRATPGGLGESAAWDVRADAPPDLCQAMALAADYDRISLQYCNNFQDVLQEVAPLLRHQMSEWGIVRGIVRSQVILLSRWPDSLIARKLGPELAQQCAARAKKVLETSGHDSFPDELALAEFDFWLRSDGNRRNPGTTADLIAAGLFAELRDGHLAEFSY